MKIARSDVSETVVKLTISAGSTELQAAKVIALQKLAPKVKLQGFRPGHAPAELVEKQLDQNQLQQETIDEVLNTLYGKALTEENIRPVAQPKVEIKKFVPYTDIEFTTEIEVVGNVNIPKYDKLGVTKPKVSVVKKDVDEVISRLRIQMAEYKLEDRVSKDGDRVWIDFAGKDAKGEEVKGAKGEDYPLALGSNTFIPGFEGNVVGMKKGENKEFTVPFPEDYGVKALQGKKVTFIVTVKKVESTKLPKLDEAFAKKVGNFESVDALKKDIEKQIKVEREQQSVKEYQDALIKKIVEKTKVELPISMLAEQEEMVDREFKQNLTYRGQTFKEYLESAGKTEEQYKQTELKPVAEERLKAGLVLSEVADREKITVTPEEVEIRIQVLKSQHESDKAMQEQLDRPEAKRDIASRLLTEKTINKIVSLNT